MTSNHVHPLVYDGAGENGIAQSVNPRKCRKGALWEDRYHATAIEGGADLLRCVAYIELICTFWSSYD